MKRLLITAFAIFSVAGTANAQRDAWDTHIPTGCFCCSESVYNVPLQLAITGPDPIRCDSPGRYSIPACPGANITWAITPTQAFSGQGTAAITLTPPYTANSYTITAALTCGGRRISGQKVVQVSAVPNCTPAFLSDVRLQSNGLLAVSTVSTAGSGVQHYWGMQYNGTYPGCTVLCAALTLSAIMSGQTFGAKVSPAGVFTALGMGTGITGSATTFSYGGFPNNSCFKITHYVICCRDTLRQVHCISFGTSNLKTAPGVVPKPVVITGEIERVHE